ncbi:MAG: hypothetical protein ABIF88_00035 [archaeon]
MKGKIRKKKVSKKKDYDFNGSLGKEEFLFVFVLVFFIVIVSGLVLLGDYFSSYADGVMASPRIRSATLVGPAMGVTPVSKTPIYVYSGSNNIYTGFPPLVYGYCLDPDCNGIKNSLNLLPPGQYPHIEKGTDGLALISWAGNNLLADGGLKLIKCLDLECSNYNLQVIEPEASPIVAHDLVVGSDGIPFIIYVEIKQGIGSDVKMYRCSDVSCSSGVGHTFLSSTGVWDGYVGDFFNVVLKSDGNPFFAVLKNNLGVGPQATTVSCQDKLCLQTIDSTISESEWGIGVSTVIGGDGFPSITYNNFYDGKLYFSHCLDVDCIQKEPSMVLSGVGGGNNMRMILNAQGYPLISYFKWTGGNIGDQVITNCYDYSCSNSKTNTFYGDASSFVTLGHNNLPLVALYSWTGPNLAFKILNCKDYACNSFSESSEIISPYSINLIEMAR